MLKRLEPAALLVMFLLLSSALAQAPPVLSLEDEVRAGNALVASFFRLNEVGETQESQRIEEYLQKVGDKVAQHSTRKLDYRFYLDPHPGFHSAVAYPGGQVIVGGGVLALMQHEDELAIVLGHEIAHVDLKQYAERVIHAMQSEHLTPEQFDKLSIEDFGKPYGKDGELAADREGLRVAQADGYSPRAAIQLFEVYQFLARDQKADSPRTDAPSMEERVRQAQNEIKHRGWDTSKAEQPLDLP